MGDWVLIFIQISGFFSPAVNVQPVYFQTEQACRSTALEFNNGTPEPSRDKPKQMSGVAFGAICRPTR